jgi:EAL domain-containing protein (putative c-di-GMP-specific phosphodiesterase class I)
MRDADTALYQAKNVSKGGYQIFNPTMHQKAVDLLQWETDLRQAIAHQEFRLHYQPIVKLETGELLGFEALLRWQHPHKGLVFPREFMAIAEETGLIIPLGSWILKQACQQLKIWQSYDKNSETHNVKIGYNCPLTMSVNLSSQQLVQPNILEKIDQILNNDTKTTN